MKSHLELSPCLQFIIEALLASANLDSSDISDKLGIRDEGEHLMSIHPDKRRMI
jgi:hypothetical protein